MSLSDNYKPVKYIGNGATKDFSFDFNMINDEYCRVFLEDKETGEQTPKTIETDYTLVFDENGGQVSMKVAPTADQYIVVYRDVDLNQKSDFRVGEGFAAVKIENEFDKQMAAMQQLDDGLSRAPKVSEGYNVDLTLPAPDAGKALIWNASENGFKNSTVDVDHLEEVTKQYRDEAEAARDAAQESASNAKESEDNAKQSETAASGSASAAAQSASEAQTSADKAAQYAESASFGNIGDVKYTTRTDVPNGGAWCDGAEYTQAAFPDLYQMLVDGKISSTDYSTFNNSVSTNGACGLFALDTEKTSFKVPLLKDVYVKAGDTPLAFSAESLPNIKGNSNMASHYATEVVATGVFASSTRWTSEVSVQAGTRGGIINFSASDSSSVYKDRAKVNPDHVVYRAYVVLYSSAAEASEVQAAEFINALANKANVDLSNVDPNSVRAKVGIRKEGQNYNVLEKTMGLVQQLTEDCYLFCDMSSGLKPDVYIVVDRCNSNGEQQGNLFHFNKGNNQFNKVTGWSPLLKKGTYIKVVDIREPTDINFYWVKAGEL